MVVLKRSYNHSEFNKKEILRYALCNDADENIGRLLEECIRECRDVFAYNVCYCELPIKMADKEIDLTFMKSNSKSLYKNLDGCKSIVLFAATVGIEIDRLIAKYGRISPAKAVLFQAIGAERIETLCDLFNDDMKNKFSEDGLYIRPRFSPGYGDFPLEVQKDIFRVLDCPRKIGLSLNDSLLMSPSKSVTAIIGVSGKSTECKSSCDTCTKSDCTFRRDK